MNKKLYILRNEGVSTFREIRKNTKTVGEKYDQFYNKLWGYYISKLVEILKESLPSKNISIEIFKLADLENKKRKYLDGSQVISIDSYTSLLESHMLGISRIFNWNGKKKIMIGPRPGYADIEKQLLNIKKTYPNQEFILVEDDIFSGGTIKYLLKKASHIGLKIKKIIVGIQVSNISDDTANLIPIKKFDPKEVLEVVDPRDFLFGAYEAGLVVKFKNMVGRAPYVLPFIDVTARAGIPDNQEVSFSKKIILLNHSLFSKIKSDLGVDVQVKDCGGAFQNFITLYFQVNFQTSILKICNNTLEKFGVGAAKN